MTDITVTEYSFGKGNDMLDPSYEQTPPQRQVERQFYSVDVFLYGDIEIGETDAIDAYIINGFLKIVFADGQTIYHNVNEIKSFVVTEQ